MDLKEHEKFIVSQKAILIRGDKCLIFGMTKHLGEWELPGGRVDLGEDGDAALRRELKEELNMDDFEIIATVDHEIWHTAKNIPVCAIAILIKNDDTEIIMSNEHLSLEWIEENEIENYNFFWPYTARMIRRGFKAHKSHKNNKDS